MVEDSLTFLLEVEVLVVLEAEALVAVVLVVAGNPPLI
jgi:hypothetical protein